MASIRMDDHLPPQPQGSLQYFAIEGLSSKIRNMRYRSVAARFTHMPLILLTFDQCTPSPLGWMN